MRAKKPAGSLDVSGALGPVSDVTSASVMGAGDAEAEGAFRLTAPRADPTTATTSMELRTRRRIYQPPGIEGRALVPLTRLSTSCDLIFVPQPMSAPWERQQRQVMRGMHPLSIKD